jgi:transcriptional regulator with XRE-family HTH domain
LGEKRGPTLRGQWLGAQLRIRREAAKLTLKDAAEYLQRDPSTVSRFETGVYPIRRPDLLALLGLYHVTDQRERDELFRLSEEAWQTGWWDRYAANVAVQMIDYIWLESRARKIRSYQMVVPGLLQTREYGEALIRAGDPVAAEEQITAWVEVRLARQQVLMRDDPVELKAIVDEVALRRQVGGPAVMREQLRHLLMMIERPNVEVRVLPFTAGAHASMSGTFEIFEMQAPYPDASYVENRAGAIYLETDDVEVLDQAYDRLGSTALGPDESAGMISALIKK